MSKKTYIYKGKEYQLTGRIANRTVRNQQKTLQEIRPSNIDVDNKEYNVWVDMSELYEVVDSEGNSNEE